VVVVTSAAVIGAPSPDARPRDNPDRIEYGKIQPVAP